MKEFKNPFPLIIIMGLASGLRIGPVQLVGKIQYIRYRLGPMPNNSVIECPLELDEGEELKEVSWKLWHDDNIAGTYKWNYMEGGVADGLLYDVVKLDREDGHLELTSLRYDLSGDYSCSAITNKEIAHSQRWEVLIIDLTAIDYIDTNKQHDCKVNASRRFHAVFPEPTVHSGLYSEKLDSFYEEVTSRQWHKIRYENGSVAYSYEGVVFEINKSTPLDAYILTSLGVTKSDGTYVSLINSKDHFTSITDKGCPPMKLEEHQVVQYSHSMHSCRGEYIPFHSKPLEAEVKCDKGYNPNGNIKEVIFMCNKNSWSWVPKQNSFSVGGLKCEIDIESGGIRCDGNTGVMVSGLLLLLILRW